MEEKLDTTKSSELIKSIVNSSNGPENLCVNGVKNSENGPESAGAINSKNISDIASSKKKQSRRRTKVKNISDPDVLDISDKMSTSLLIKSPDNKMDDSSDNDGRNTTPVKIDAFQFMMNSRHKVIGSNSPGKDKKDVEILNEDVCKEKLNKRKAIFVEWSERKGSSKRKYADEAQEKYVAKALLKRRKRMKNMLSIIDKKISEAEESDQEIGVKKTMSRSRVIIDSETSNDATEIGLTEEEEGKSDENRQNCSYGEILAKKHINRDKIITDSETSNDTTEINVVEGNEVNSKEQRGEDAETHEIIAEEKISTNKKYKQRVGGAIRKNQSLREIRVKNAKEETGENAENIPEPGKQTARECEKVSPKRLTNFFEKISKSPGNSGQKLDLKSPKQNSVTKSVGSKKLPGSSKSGRRSKNKFSLSLKGIQNLTGSLSPIKMGVSTVDIDLLPSEIKSNVLISNNRVHESKAYASSSEESDEEYMLETSRKMKSPKRNSLANFLGAKKSPGNNKSGRKGKKEYSLSLKKIQNRAESSSPVKSTVSTSDTKLLSGMKSTNIELNGCKLVVTKSDDSREDECKVSDSKSNKCSLEGFDDEMFPKTFRKLKSPEFGLKNFLGKKKSPGDNKSGRKSKKDFFLSLKGAQNRTRSLSPIEANVSAPDSKLLSHQVKSDDLVSASAELNGFKLDSNNKMELNRLNESETKANESKSDECSLELNDEIFPKTLGKTETFVLVKRTRQLRLDNKIVVSEAKGSGSGKITRRGRPRKADRIEKKTCSEEQEEVNVSAYDSKLLSHQVKSDDLVSASIELNGFKLDSSIKMELNRLNESETKANEFKSDEYSLELNDEIFPKTLGKTETFVLVKRTRQLRLDNKIVVSEAKGSGSEKKTRRGRPKKVDRIEKKTCSEEREDANRRKTRGSERKLYTEKEEDQFESKAEKKTEKEACVFTPRTWRMRVRLLEKENVSNEDDSDGNDKNVIIIDDDTSRRNDKLRSIENSRNVDEKVAEKRQVKLAPLFLRKKVDPGVAEARRNFLHSGMPNQVKKIIAKQQSPLEYIPDLFPKISHVQQKSDEEPISKFWNLPNVPLPFMKELDNPLKYHDIFLGAFTSCKSLEEQVLRPKVAVVLPTKLTNVRKLINEIKKQEPTYPAYRTFRLLYQKYEKQNCPLVENEAQAEEVREKNTEIVEKHQRRKKGTPKRQKEKSTSPASAVENSILPKAESSQKDQKVVDSGGEMCMWTEKYKPQSFEDLIANLGPSRELKTWLESWVAFSEDQKAAKKRKRLNSNSSDDFCSDSDTRESEILPQNTVVLIGPSGCGKTAVVYALCSELSINIIEINASSKRPGKRILNELQEATQSHQVKNSEASSFFQKRSEDESGKKLSLLLVEDVDIVFEEQDDGFISALSTLVASSKRPIILTTTDPECNHLQKFVSQHSVISFREISPRIGPYLQIMCLIEGVLVEKGVVEQLLEWNKGDLRKTIIQLQFWIQTGGNREPVSSGGGDLKLLHVGENLELPNDGRSLGVSNADGSLNPCDADTNSKLLEVSNIPEETQQAFGTLLGRCSIDKDLLAQDESSNLSWLKEQNSSESKAEVSVRFHKNCNHSFVPYYERDKPGFKIPYPVHLGSLWWNIPSIIGFSISTPKVLYKSQEIMSEKLPSGPFENEPTFSDEIFPKEPSQSTQISVCDEKSGTETPEKCRIESDGVEKNTVRLKEVIDILESFVFADTISEKVEYEDLEPGCNFWEEKPESSLSLAENFSMYSENKRTSEEIAHFLVEENVKQVFTQPGKEFQINVAIPGQEETKWREKRHKSMRELLPIIPPNCVLDRSAICADYQPMLRCITRIEQRRFINNNKRKNRFYHYFKTFNVHLAESTNLVLCNTLATDSEY